MSGQHYRAGTRWQEHTHAGARRPAIPRAGLAGQLLSRCILPCALLAVLFALVGSALYANALARRFDARGQAMAMRLALDLSLAGGDAVGDRLRLRSRQLLAQGFARRIELRRGDGPWIGIGDDVASLRAPRLYTGGDAAAVRVYADRAALARAQQRIWLVGAVAIALVALLAWLAQHWLQWRVVRPLRELCDQLRAPRVMCSGGDGMRELERLRSGIASLQRQTSEARRSVRASTSEALQHSATAQAAFAGKAQFLAAVGDRLRQPLHAMHLFVGALQRNATPAQRPSIESLQGIVNTMSELLEELLEISRLDAHVVAAQAQPLAVSELFAGQRQSFEAQAQARAVTVHWHDGGLWLRGDAELVGRVLRHLLANAIEHAIGGRVLVAARRCGDRVRLEVRDNGTGIARIHQVQIFEEFFQLVSSEQRQRRLGLGLPICARIAALLGTRIDLRSELGQGSSFRIELPRVAPVVPPEAAAMTAAQAR